MTHADESHALAVLGTDEDPLSDDALTGRHRVWQRVRGHRYSLDDVATAHEALSARPHAASVADLGCGLGSVLLMLAYGLPESQLVGVEAQALSFELVTRNVARNDEGHRIRLVHGDLRTVAATLGGPFDLVTGTPPYAKPGTATPPPDSQKAHARIELRGGVEDYLAAMGPMLAEGGAAVVCCDARSPERALRGGEAAGLTAVRRRDFVPREGGKPLFTVWVFERAGEAGSFEHAAPFVARRADGERSDDYLALRTFFGLPPSFRPA